MMGRMRRLASRVGLVAVLTLSGCASWFMKGEAPEVLVTNVTPLSYSVTSVETSTSTLQVVRQLLSFSGDQPLTYHVTGVLHTKEGRLPFDSAGVLLEKGALSGSPAAP